MGVKRFDLIESIGGEGWMEEASLGEYVKSADYDALQEKTTKLCAELQKALRATLGWRPAHLLNTDEKYLLALAYPPQTNPEGNAK